MFEITKDNVIGIGKIKLYPTSERPYDIPILHYVLLQESDSSFSAICIELRIEANAKTVKSVREKIVESTEIFIVNTFKFAPNTNAAYDSLINLAEIDGANIQQWNVYRFCQMKLSCQGMNGYSALGKYLPIRCFCYYLRLPPEVFFRKDDCFK